MATSRADIKRWIDTAKKNGAEYLIVATDTFDWEDYPVEASRKTVESEVARLGNPSKMTKVMEVYDLALPIGPQLNEHRAWHLPA